MLKPSSSTGSSVTASQPARHFVCEVPLGWLNEAANGPAQPTHRQGHHLGKVSPTKAHELLKVLSLKHTVDNKTPMKACGTLLTKGCSRQGMAEENEVEVAVAGCWLVIVVQ